jgi:hypothetical protein
LTSFRSQRSSGAEKTMTPGLSPGGKRHQRASELAREAVVVQVGRATQIVVLEHEQDIPAERHAHVFDDAARDVRVGVHARPFDDARNDRPKFRR